MKLILLILLSSSLALADEQPLAEETRNPWEVSVSAGMFEGGVYLGGRKTPADFNNYNLEITKRNQSFFWGIKLQRIQNQSALKISSISPVIGKEFKLNTTLSIDLSGQIGFSHVEESTAIQKVQGGGLNFGAETSLKYHLDSYFMGLGLRYDHSTFSESYWGSDVYDDIATDFIGPFIKLGFSF